MNSTPSTPRLVLPLAALSVAGFFSAAPVGRAQPPSAATYQVVDPNGAPQPAPSPALAQPLNQLVAPIALYPDPLVALILPAAVFPGQIAAAAQYLSGGGDPNAIGNFNWDDSVRALTHYPQILQWMAANAQWTQDLGAAFGSDPAAVMAAVQQMRAVAQSAGTLVSTPQQQVVDDNGQIEIEPAVDSQIYIPSYDPAVVYVDRPYYDGGGGYIDFGNPWVTGAWLGYGFNWEARALWYGGPGEWHGGGGHGFRAYHGAPPANVHPWQAPANFHRSVQVRSALAQPPAPRPIRGLPLVRSTATYQANPRADQHPTRPAVNYHASGQARGDVNIVAQPQPRSKLEQLEGHPATRVVEHAAPASATGTPARQEPSRPEMFSHGPEHREPSHEMPAHAEVHSETHPAAPVQHAAPAPHPAPAPAPRAPAPATDERHQPN